MDFQHEDGRYFLQDENDKLLAEINYPPIDDGKSVVITHTYVDPSLRGQGIAGKLVKLVVDEARAKGFTIEPVCTYARHAFAKHAEYADVLRPVKPEE
ncbi:GNAT family N-acetyltransferase [Lacticaseibacillus zhaodongensis]|uniref:GNAT family N-acetyltransferase n=1 Tax=Lacticaseibacillus zhaodongensis TaxID=2668065 RepID=UPI0012D338BC|nr:GNAT family N-acetyltransferase [Lacticaseibacillus zhaodongensis]